MEVGLSSTIKDDFSRELYISDSGQIKGAKYALNTGGMLVRFTNGSLYYFTSVPPSVWAGLASADSVGKFFAENIKNKYKFRKIG